MAALWELISSFFSPCFIYLLTYFLSLYNIVLVLPYIDMNPPWVYMCSPSWTPLPSPSPSFPSELSQCTSPEHPVSCIEPGLAIRFTYDITHVSMPFSQIIPPSPSPTESKRLFYIHLCLFCGLAYRVIIAINWWIFNFTFGSQLFLSFAFQSRCLFKLITCNAYLVS